jgi:hypothetical protein
MAKSKAKAKSAMDTLVDSFSDLVEDARKRMFSRRIPPGGKGIQRDYRQS